MTMTATGADAPVAMTTHRVTIGIDRTTSYYFKHEIALPADTPADQVDALLAEAVKEMDIDEITDGEDDGSAEGEYLDESVRIAEGDDDEDEDDDDR
jgi:hypothetical protein